MKKVLLLCGSLGGGGLEKVFADTANVLKNHFDVKLVLMDKADTEYFVEVEKTYLNVKKRKGRIGRLISAFERYFKWCAIRRREKPDIVYTPSDVSNLYNVLSSFGGRGKTIVSMHAFSLIKKNRTNSFIFKRAKKVVCISKVMQKSLLELYPNLSNTVVIQNGYPIDNIISKSKDDVQMQVGKPNFVALGRLSKVKAFDRLLLAFKKVSEQIPTAKLSIIGKGELKDNLINLTSSLQLEDKVEFLGFHANPYAFVGKSDIFVLSSRNEGFPNALVESLACGLACMSVDCNSGPREILAEDFDNCVVKGVLYEKYGVLTEYSNDEDELIDNLANAMITLSKDKEKLDYYKSVSVQRAYDFSLEKYCNKLIELFEQVK